MSVRSTRLLITAGALGVIAARMYWPTLKIDGVTLGLLAMAVLPWLSSVIKSAELPGGWKVEFQAVQQAGAKITGAEGPAVAIAPPSYVEVATIDPNLALVGLRIEIEKRLRQLAEQNGIREQRSLSRLVQELHQRGVLGPQSTSGLQELIIAGNQAAHGADVSASAAAWAIDYGPQVLAALEGSVVPR